MKPVTAFSFCPPTRLSVSLWREAFGGEKGQIEADLRALEVGGARGIGLLSEDGACLSQGVALRFALPDAAGYYLYALTTARSARGQGHMRTLLRETARRAAEEGLSFLFLLPGGEALAASYRRMGFDREYPAGASPLPLCSDDFYYRAVGKLPFEGKKTPSALNAKTEPPLTPEELGSPLSPPLFAFALSTLEKIFPVRLEKGAALLFSGDARRAMAFSPEASGLFSRETQGIPFLLQTLDGRCPAGLPEPLPR